MGGAKVSLGGGGGGGAGTPARPLLPVAALPVNAGEAPNATLPAPAVREEEKQKVPGISYACQRTLLEVAHDMQLPVTKRH